MLELLSQVKAKTQPAVASPPKKPNAKTTNHGFKLDNLFASLDVEEPSGTPLGIHTPTTQTPKAATRASRAPKTPERSKAGATTSTAKVSDSSKLIFKLEHEDDDDGFATWCFLQDLNDVRVFVGDAWREYSRGEISFLAASSITDTAFGLLHSADDEFGKIRSTHWPDLLHYFGLTHFERETTVWVCPETHGSAAKKVDGASASNLNIVELLCPVAFICLRTYIADAHEICLPK